MAGDFKQKLINLRMGNAPKKIITLGNGEKSVKVGVILLSSDIMLNMNEMVDRKYGHEVEIEDPDKIAENIGVSISKTTRMQYYNILLCYNCLRNPDDFNEYIFDSYEEASSILNLEDVTRICDAYNEILVNSAPKLEVISEEEFEELKKFLEVTSLKDLNTVSLIHLKYFHQTMHSNN